jgi:hypothetical protein
MKKILDVLGITAMTTALLNVWEVCRVLTHRHKWEYSIQEDKITFSAYSTSLTLNRKTRYCEKCGRKESTILGGNNSSWHESKLTKEEERDKKLKDLGIH